MPDYSYLSNVQIPQIQDPMTLATRGASLADILNKVQTGQLALETARQRAALWQDPTMGPLISNLLGGASGVPGMPGMPGQGGPGLDPDTIAGIQQRYGYALPGTMGELIGLAEKQAVMRKDIAAGALDYQKVHDLAVTDISNSADTFNNHPSIGNYLSTLFKVSKYGLQHEFPNLPDPRSASAEDIMNAMSQITATTAESRAKISSEAAGAAEARGRTALQGPEFELKARNTALDWAKFLGGTAQRDPDTGTYTVVKPVQDPTTGEISQKIVWAGATGSMKAPEMPTAPTTGAPTPGGTGLPAQPGAPTAGVKLAPGTFTSADLRKMADDMDKAAQAATPAGQSGPPSSSAAAAATSAAPGTPAPVPTTPAGAAKPGLSAPEKRDIEVGKEALKPIVDQSVQAAPMKTMIEGLRQEEAKGIYSGGIMGTDFWQRMANIFSFALSPEQLARLGNTQAYAAEKGTLVAQAIKTFGGVRVAGPEIQFFQNIKPQELSTPQGREQLYQNLWSLADKMQQLGTQAHEYLQKPGADQSLASFQPAFKDNPMPPVKFAGLPDPRMWRANNPNSAMTTDDGRTLVVRNVGGRWTWVDRASGKPEVPGVTPPASMPPGLSSQIPQ